MLDVLETIDCFWRVVVAAYELVWAWLRLWWGPWHLIQLSFTYISEKKFQIFIFQSNGSEHIFLRATPDPCSCFVFLSVHKNMFKPLENPSTTHDEKNSMHTTGKVWWFAYFWHVCHGNLIWCSFFLENLATLRDTLSKVIGNLSGSQLRMDAKWNGAHEIVYQESC